MSEKDAPNQAASEPSDPAPDEGSGHSASTDRGNSGKSAPKAAGRWAARLALVLSLVALGGVGWLYYQDLTEADPGLDQEAADSAALRAELAAVREQLAAVDAGRERIESEWSQSTRAASERLEAIEREQSRVQQRLEATEIAGSDDDRIQSTLSRQDDVLQSLERRLDEIGQSQSDLAASLTAVESRVDGVARSMQEQQGIQREVDRDLALKLDLLEIAALVAIGQSRIELTGDKDAARIAYEQARRQLTAISDRRLNPVTARLAEEIALIESWSEPDWARINIRLGQWERQVAEWPLRAETGAPPVPNQASGPEQEAGWLSTVRQSLGQLVTVERLDGLSLDEGMIVAIREQLQLHLAAAGLAVQRRDTGTLQLRLDQVIALVDEFFQVDSEPLVSIRPELETIADIEVPLPPDGLGQAASALDRVIEAL